MNAPRWLPNQTIECRIELGFSAILALVACISLVSVWSPREIENLTKIADDAELLKSQTFEAQVSICRIDASHIHLVSPDERPHPARHCHPSELPLA